MKFNRPSPHGRKKFGMIFSKLILLIFIFSIDRIRARNTATLTINDSADDKVENMLTEFMTDLKKSSFDKLDYRCLMVLGRNKVHLQSINVLLKKTPYFISNKASATLHFSWYLRANSVALIFINDFTSSEMETIFATLPADYSCKVFLISINENASHKTAVTTIAKATKMNVKNVWFVGFDGQVIKVHRKHVGTNCQTQIRVINTWVPRTGFKKNKSLFGRRNKRADFHGCPMRVSTLKLESTMILEEDENKSVQIRGGTEGRLVTSIAEYLNLVPVIQIPTVNEKIWITPNGTVEGIIGHVARGEANFGIGQIRLTSRRAKMVDFTMSYNYECIVWTVPFETEYNLSVILSEFSSTTWMLVLLALVLFCGLVHVILIIQKKVNPNHRGSSFNIFDVIAMSLTYAVRHHSRSANLLSKLLFLLYLHYSRIISTAYMASLSSILTTTVPQSTNLDDKGILAAGLRTAGTKTCRELLIDQISPNSTRVELINRYEVITSVTEALARLTDQQDIAYLRHRSTINYAAQKLVMAGKPIKFISLPDCVVSFHPVIVTRKGSPLTGMISKVILRLCQSGIVQYWIKSDHEFEYQTKIPQHNNYLLHRLKPIFILYLCCLIPAFLAFITELIIFELKRSWFTR